MRRRSVLRSLAGAAGLSALAGCNALSVGESEPTRAGATDVTATDEPSGPAALSESAPAEPSRPYRAAGEPVLDRPRGVHVRNLGSTERFVTVVVTAPDEDENENAEILAASTAVPAGETASFPSLLRTEGRYGVLVETADGRRDRYDWTVVDTLDDLWVDLVPEPSFQRPVFCAADSPFVVGEPTVAYDVPADVGVSEALGRAPALALDNDTFEEMRVRLKIWHQGRLRLDARYALPSDVRALVPVFPAGRRYDILVRSRDGESIYDWQPLVRNTLYAALAGGPTFRCGNANHDLRVRNESDTPRRLRVRVLTGNTTLFERVFALGANDRTTVSAAVEPAGPFRFEVATEDGLTETYNWVRCAPNGPIVVAASDDAVSVSVRPTVSGGS
jgi:hypothetical protein